MQNRLARFSRYKDRMFKISARDVLSSIGPFTIIFLLSLTAAYLYIDPAPPHRVITLVGHDDSDYLDYAENYKEVLARDNVTLEIRQSKGTLDNLRLLKSNTFGADIAFTLDGLHDEQDADIYSLGSIAYEPLWVFYRDRKVHKRLSDLQGKRIAIGKEDSGTKRLAERLLAANDISTANAMLVPVGREEAAGMLHRGEVDAAFFVGQPDSALIKVMLADPNLRVFDFDQAEAYTRRFPFLHQLVLPHGIIDLHRNIPATDIHMLATTTTLIARDTLHPAIISLMMNAMTEVHDGPGLLHKEHAFPEDKDVDFDLSPDAQRYYKSGPPFLQRYLPFWLATLIDRAMLIIIPVVALLIPASKTIPKIYMWRIKARINRWYGELMALEAKMVKGSDYDEYQRTVEWIEAQVARVPVPLMFSEYLFVLKEHIDLVRRKILRLKEDTRGGAASTASEDGLS